MSPAFPRLRWVSLVWLIVWGPAYGAVWGRANFLHLCDIAVFLVCVGLWRGSSLLLSSQALGSILAGVAWGVDAGGRLLSGQHPVGGTEYMWDARFPLWVRLLSLFHVLLPGLLVWSLRCVGYDRRGWALQSAITAGALVASRFLDPALNINYAFRDPLFHRSWGPAPAHLALIFLGFNVLFYWPTHFVLARLCPPPRRPFN